MKLVHRRLEQSFACRKQREANPSLYISYDGNTKKTLTAEEFREMGRDYLTRLVTDYPDSSFRGQADEALKVAGGAKKQ